MYGKLVIILTKFCIYIKMPIDALTAIGQCVFGYIGQVWYFETNLCLIHINCFAFG